MEKVILGLDQSTSGTKLIIVNREGQIIYKESIEHKQYYPEPGYVEHDMKEVFQNCLTLLAKGIEFTKDSYIIENLSITNQRETIVFWDSISMQPLSHAYVWQCRRGTNICKDLIDKGYDEVVKKKTGLKLDPYFSASKIKWALQNNPEVIEADNRETLRIGTVDSYLIYCLTGGKVHATDHTNASRTLLYNINSNAWDNDLLDLFLVKPGMLPKLLSSNDNYGNTDELIVGAEIPIVGVIGDSQGALFGQMCFEIGYGKATYGTGSSIMMYTGDKKIDSDKGIMTSIAWSVDNQVVYAIEGMINSSGDTLKWVKDSLGLFDDDSEVESIISSIDSNEGVYIVPAFSGLGAPYWKTDARASIVGISRKTGKAQIIRAAVESMAYQVADLVELMETELGEKLEVLYVDGGPTANSILMQLQADLLNTRLQTGANKELSCLGAVYLGGLKLGFWSSLEELKALKEKSVVYEPDVNNVETEKLMNEWHKAINSVLV